MLTHGNWNQKVCGDDDDVSWTQSSLSKYTLIVLTYKNYFSNFTSGQRHPILSKTMALPPFFHDDVYPLHVMVVYVATLHKGFSG